MIGVGGQGSVVGGQWSVVGGQWSGVGGQWSGVGGGVLYLRAEDQFLSHVVEFGVFAKAILDLI